MTTKTDANRVLKKLGMPALKRAQTGGARRRPRRIRRGQHGDGFFDTIGKIGKTALRGLDSVGLKPSDVVKFAGNVSGNKNIGRAGNLLGRVGYGHCGRRRRPRR